jgi:hypothetical protein
LLLKIFSFLEIESLGRKPKETCSGEGALSQDWTNPGGKEKDRLAAKAEIGPL